MSETTCRSSYLHEVLDLAHRSVVIPEMVNQLTKFGLDKFDTIVFRGMSGALIVPTVADRIQKAMLMIRKGDSHSTWNVEGNILLKSYVIIDDLIASGETIRNILEGVASTAENVTDCKGIFLYRDQRHAPYQRAENSFIPTYAFYYDKGEKKFIYGENPMGS